MPVFLPPKCEDCGADPGEHHLSWCPYGPGIQGADDETTYTFWAIQNRSRRSGWYTIPSMVRPTRAEAIAAWRAMWDSSKVQARLSWRRRRDAGKIRCVKVKLIAPEGMS